MLSGMQINLVEVFIGISLWENCLALNTVTKIYQLYIYSIWHIQPQFMLSQEMFIIVLYE